MWVFDTEVTSSPGVAFSTMLLWLAHRAWNLLWDPQGVCLRRRGAFFFCDFGLPRTGSSSAAHSGGLDSLYSSSGTSSSSAWTLGLKWNGLKPLEPFGPTGYNGNFIQTLFSIISLFFLTKQRVFHPSTFLSSQPNTYKRKLNLFYPSTFLSSLLLHAQKILTILILTLIELASLY